MKPISVICAVMMTTTMAVLVVAVCSASLRTDNNNNDDHYECGPFQMYQTCGTTCPEHCPMLNRNTGKIEIRNPFCNKMCVPGCFCAEGYVRDIKRQNHCVKRDLCSAP